MKMKERDELLVIAMEECSEVAIECSKLIRFGSETFAEVMSLEKEIGDLQCMIRLMHEYGLIDLNKIEPHITAKREKLKKWSNLNV
jgi:hypothetical protein